MLTDRLKENDSLMAQLHPNSKNLKQFVIIDNTTMAKQRYWNININNVIETKQLVLKDENISYKRISNKITTERINNFFRDSKIYDCDIMVGLIEYDNFVYYTLVIQQKQSGNSLESIYKNMVLINWIKIFK